MANTINRREFIKKTSLASAGAIIAPDIIGKAAPIDSDEIRVGLIGAGEQARVLWDVSQNIPGIRFVAVCDIWERQRKSLSTQMNWLKARGHIGTPYEDYEEMLDKEQLDAVIIATPDCWHSRQACAAMEKGLDVYCENMMANTREDAQKMVETAQKTGKLLQIGYHTRSNPIYNYCFDNLIKGTEVMAGITMVNGHWHQPKVRTVDYTWRQRDEIPENILHKFGYENMHKFRNWWHYKQTGNGLVGLRASHQLDIYR